MGNAEERAFITGDGVGKPLGLLAETGGAKVGVTAGSDREGLCVLSNRFT